MTDAFQRRSEAVALAYTAGESAPRVVAKGKGVIAREILERAREAGVYVHESPELLSLLMQVDLDARIPPQLYVAVAELLAWLYRLEQGGDSGQAAPALELPSTLLPPRKDEDDDTEEAGGDAGQQGAR